MSDKDWDDGVKKAMKAKMIPFAILKKEGVDFDKIYAEKTKELAKQYSTEVESLEAQYDSYYGASYGTDSLKYVVAMQQIIDIIADNVKEMCIRDRCMRGVKAATEKYFRLMKEKSEK